MLTLYDFTIEVSVCWPPLWTSVEDELVDPGHSVIDTSVFSAVKVFIIRRVVIVVLLLLAIALLIIYIAMLIVLLQ
jgi:hypothetical protein